MRSRPPSLLTLRSVRSWLPATMLVLVLLCSSFVALPQATASAPASLPAAGHASIASGGNFFSAVPQLTAADQLAVTSFADTVIAPDFGHPALLGVGSTAAALASLAQVGAIYGLAYDDGSYSGAERILIGAYTKRFVQFGPLGPDGIYQYIINFPANPSLNGQLHSFTHPSWGNQRDAGPDSGIHGHHTYDTQGDSSANFWFGRSAYGDLEISPDGRTLYAVNLYTRQIDTWDLRSAAFTGAIALNTGLIPAWYSDAAHLVPFALQFYPLPVYLSAGAAPTPVLTIGVTDTAEGNTRDDGLGDQPDVFVLSYVPATGQWLGLSLAQPLLAVPRNLERGSFFPSSGPDWFPWQRATAGLRHAGNRAIVPMPLLTDIAFSRDGQSMLLGIRDIVGDMTFFQGSPAQITSVAQGDTLRYRLVGGAWSFQGAETYADDWDRANTVDPSHAENHMGGLATTLQSITRNLTPYAGYREELQISSLFGADQSGLYTYADSGGDPAAAVTLNAPSPSRPGSKASMLGDVEYLASFAIVGGRVWHDTNYNGTYASGEPALANVTVQYLDAAGTVHGGATTGADGVYLMAVPPNTNFTLRIAPGDFSSVLSGYRVVRQDVGDAGNPHHDPSTDSDVDMATRRIEFGTSRIPTRLRDSDTRSYSFGLTREWGSGRVRGIVWNDINHDARMAGEPRWPNVRVFLERDDTRSGGAGVRDYAAMAVQTDSHGAYAFDRIEPGYYRVRFEPLAHALDSAVAHDNHANAASGWTSDWFVVDETANRNQLRNAAMRLGTDVAITKSGPPAVLVGEQFSYTLGYRNSGGQADNVRVEDTLPAGVTFVSASPAPSSRSGQLLVWQLGTLGHGMSGSITVRVRAETSAAASVTNRARIVTTALDTDPSNNHTSYTTRVLRPRLSVSKSGPATAIIGDGFSYTLTVRNQGDGTAHDVWLEDTLPSGITFGSASPAPSSQSGQRLAWHLGPVGAGVSSSVTIHVNSDVATVPFDASAKHAQVTNRALVVTSTPDDPDDNAANASTTIQVPDLAVALTTDAPTYPVGQRVTLQARVANTGTTASAGTQLRVTLPDGLVYISGSSTSSELDSTTCTFDAASRVVTCETGRSRSRRNVRPGRSGTVRIAVEIPGTLDPAVTRLDFAASISNAVPEHASTLADNHAGHTIGVLRPNPYVEVTAPGSAVDGGVIGQGSYFAYTVTYGNDLAHLGRPSSLTAAADAVELRINLAADVTFVDVDTANQGRCSERGGTVTCRIGHLAPRVNGQQILVIVRTNAPAGTDLPVEAIISTTSPGDDLSDNRDTATTTVVPPPTTIPPGNSTLTLAIHGDLDPRSQDGDPGNAVYWLEDQAMSWPLGEVLDFTPRVHNLSLDPIPAPYEYRAQVLGWSVASFTMPDGTVIPATGADGRGVVGCRGSGQPAQHQLQGCMYRYIGGANLTQIQGSAPDPTELEMHDQARAYWTHPPAPAGMTTGAYVFTLPEIGAVTLTVAVSVEIRLVTPTGGTTIGGVVIPPQDFPIPPPRIQVFQGTFDLTPVAPRTIIGPGN